MNRITEFVDKFVPRNLSPKRAEAVKSELTCHILDKVDYYKEIGYDESVSIDKAIEDFGTEEKDISYIYQEFEELYSEKKIYGVLSFLGIALMNLLCIPLNFWIMTADVNPEADYFGILGSFCLMFGVLSLVFLAGVKKYRKMLISIGVVHILTPSTVILCFYPQMMCYCIGYNMLYVLDRFTPYSAESVMARYLGDYVGFYLWLILPVILAIACFIIAKRIKKGALKPVKNPRRSYCIFACVYAIFSLVSWLLYPVSMEYLMNYM